MKKFFQVLDNIFEVLSPILFILFGVTVIVLSSIDYEEAKHLIILDILLIVNGIAKIADYIGGHKNKHEFNFDIAFGILSIALGTVALASGFDLDKICLLWGIFEIVEAAFELQQAVGEIKHSSHLIIAELVMILIQITFGILLCINVGEEVKLHLIIVGIVLLLSATVQILHTVIEHKRKER